MPENFGIMFFIGEPYRTMAEQFGFGSHLLMNFETADKALRFEVFPVVYIQSVVFHNEVEYIFNQRKRKRFFK